MTDKTINILRIALLCGLILWGGYAYLSYIAVPVHQAVLLSANDQQSVTNACPDSGTFCVALHAFLPSIINTIARAQPYMWYVVVSILLYGILLVVSFFRTGEWKMTFSMTPLKLWGCFVVLLWIFFTTFGNTTVPGVQPYSEIFQPTAEVYPGADADTLQVLSTDYANLKARGCLVSLGTTQQGTEISSLRQSCMQTSFFTRVLSQVLFITYLLFVMLSFGRFWLRMLRARFSNPLLEPMFSVALGACGLIVILWSLAVAGVYTQLAGWLILLVLPCIVWQDAWHWLKTFIRARWTYDAPWYGVTLFLAWLLISYLLFNFLTVVRPFPIGWDDLGTYLNDPRLLVSYGHFIPRLGAFQWEYMTSIGFLLFGYDSFFGATASMMINWMAGLLALCSVYVFARVYLGRWRGLLAALIYYTLPLVGHFSFADMKIDNAVFTMGALAMLAASLALFPAPSDDDDPGALEEESPTTSYDWRLLVLAGVIAGFGFAIKPTTIMVIMTICALLAGVLLQGIAFLGMAFLAWALYIYQNVFSVSDVVGRITGNPAALSSTTVLIICVVIAAVLLGIAAWLRPASVKRTAIAVGIFFGCFFLSVAPWIEHNNILAGDVIPHLILNTPNHVAPDFLVGKGATAAPGENARVLPPDLQLDANNAACKGSTSKEEELDRYWGYQQGIGHYVGLLWRTVMNIDSAGYYVTTSPALLLFPLVLLLPFFWKRGRKAQWLRWLTISTAFLIFQWMFLANGVPWYGIGMFLGVVIALEALIYHGPDRTTKSIAAVLIALSFFITFANRFWEAEQQRNLYAYAFGAVSGQAMQERTIPHYDHIKDIVLQRVDAFSDRPYVYRIGTFIPYFIPRNQEIIPIADNQLDLFTCLNQEDDHALTLKRMEALGFNNIIFDTNTATIEQDPNGTLHKKVNAFLDFLNDPSLHLQVVVNDTDGGIVFVLLP